jgi:murein DD-endopeptidase MepM/ murein hydrolase activator NlpD
MHASSNNLEFSEVSSSIDASISTVASLRARLSPRTEDPSSKATLQDILKSLDRPRHEATFIAPIVGYVSSGYGQRNRDFHSGIDIEAAPGTPVKSSADGTVESSGWMGGYGLVVEVRHSDRMITRYAHLSKVLLPIGRKVRAGEVIALSGATGRTTGPHLHFEVRVDEKAQNPEKYVPALLQFASRESSHRG